MVRELDASSDEEVDLVARRMRATLVEVLGQERGEAMYSLDWLRDRVRFHLDPARSVGAVFVAEDTRDTGPAIVGHTIVRIHDPSSPTHGLFSTTYVVPERRGTGVGDALLDRGEQWMRELGLPAAMTHTDPRNHPLIELYRRRGYTQRRVTDEFVRLERPLLAPGSTP